MWKAAGLSLTEATSRVVGSCCEQISEAAEGGGAPIIDRSHIKNCGSCCVQVTKAVKGRQLLSHSPVQISVVVGHHGEIILMPLYDYLLNHMLG